MNKIEGAIAARKHAKVLLDKARNQEAKSGIPDAFAYKAAANALNAAILLEMNSTHELNRRNRGPHGISTADRIQFLKSFVAIDEDPDSLTVAVLAAKIKTEHEAEAQKYWPKKTGDDLEQVVINFAGQKGRWRRIIGGL